VADHPDRPRIESIRLTPDRLAHIVDGDERGGGHLAGTGFPGKTEFPRDWGPDRIASSVLYASYRPQGVEQQFDGSWLARGARDEVTVHAVIQPDGRIWTAWPDPGSPGVTRNPFTEDR